MDLKCSYCRNYLEPPVRQCKKETHTFCEKCIKHFDKCPQCGENLAPRNKILEKLLTETKHSCIYDDKGCQFSLLLSKKLDHEKECFYRKFKCEGRKFCDWNCHWKGNRDELENHFNKEHPNCILVNYRDERKMKINLMNSTYDLQLISAHYQLFWYKHKFDLNSYTAYWTIQFIGPRKQASYYYYELEFFISKDSKRKYKITEYCDSDTIDVNTIFNSGRCVSISFNTLQSFQQNNEINFRFIINKIPKPAADKTNTKGKSICTA